MAYEAMNFDGLIGMDGFSDQLLQNHFKLYNGYVTRTNKAADGLKSMAEAGDTEELVSATVSFEKLHRWEPIFPWRDWRATRQADKPGQDFFHRGIQHWKKVIACQQLLQAQMCITILIQAGEVAGHPGHGRGFGTRKTPIAVGIGQLEATNQSLAP